MRYFNQKYLFLVSLCITLTFFVFPYFATFNAPSYDGNTVIGFPYVAYSFGGGHCVEGGCPSQFYLPYFIVDFIFLFGTPVLIAWLFGRKK